MTGDLPVPYFFFWRESCSLFTPTGVASFGALHAWAAAWLWGTQRLVSRSPGADGGGEDLGDLDHKNHRVFGLVAECTANYVHRMLMCHSLQTLAVHGQQLIPRLQMQTRIKGYKTWLFIFHDYTYLCVFPPLSVSIFLWQSVAFQNKVMDSFHKSAAIVSLSGNVIYARENWGSPVTLIYSHWRPSLVHI